MGLDSYTSALLHFDGSDGSANIIDQTGKIWTCAGANAIDTAQYKFGRSSLLCDAVSGSTTTPDHDDFEVGSGNFTIDFWVKRDVITTGYLAIKLSSLYISINSSSQVDISGCGGVLTSSPYTLDTNWNHVAIMRNGSQKYMYINGTKCNSGNTAGTVASSTGNMLIGAFSGWMDEFRFSNGIARWNINGFAVPTAPYSSGSFVPRIMMIGE